MCGQYLWSTQGAGNIVCSCGGAEIHDHVIVKGDEVTDEVFFAALVEEETGDPPVHFGDE